MRADAGLEVASVDGRGGPAEAFDRPDTLGYAPPASDADVVGGASGPVGREPDAKHETPGLGR